MTATIHLHPRANAFGVAAAYLERTTAPDAIRPEPRPVTLSDLLADAKSALMFPDHAPAAELAGHLMLLEVYGNEDEQAYARDFAADMRHREDLALWLDVVMVPAQPKRDLLPKLAPPVSAARPGFIRGEMVALAGLAVIAVACWALLKVGA
jgi:hypothetical protein